MKKEEKIYEQQAKKEQLTKGKEELMAEYKTKLPEYLEMQLQNIASELHKTEAMEGLALLEINELIRAKGVYGQSPKYSAEELNIVFAYYRKAMAEINKYTKYIPSKENFCAFARYKHFYI